MRSNEYPASLVVLFLLCFCVSLLHFMRKTNHWFEHVITVGYYVTYYVIYQLCDWLVG